MWNHIKEIITITYTVFQTQKKYFFKSETEKKEFCFVVKQQNRRRKILDIYYKWWVITLESITEMIG